MSVVVAALTGRCAVLLPAGAGAGWRAVRWRWCFIARAAQSGHKRDQHSSIHVVRAAGGVSSLGVAASCAALAPWPDDVCGQVYDAGSARTATGCPVLGNQFLVLFVWLLRSGCISAALPYSLLYALAQGPDRQQAASAAGTSRSLAVLPCSIRSHCRGRQQCSRHSLWLSLRCCRCVF